MVAVDKVNIFNEVFGSLSDNGLRISRFDRSMSWGGFFVIQEASSKLFVETYFKNVVTRLQGAQYFLVLAPNQKLEWYTHDVGDRLFKVISGCVIIRLKTPEKEDVMLMLSPGQSIQISFDTSSQICATDGWTTLAECISM